MRTYTYSQARQNFASLLNQAQKEGKVLIKRRDGSTFVIQPIKSSGSPLDVKGIELSLSTEEVVQTLREVRER